jgi:hypothetical protein
MRRTTETPTYPAPKGHRPRRHASNRRCAREVVQAAGRLTAIALEPRADDIVIELLGPEQPGDCLPRDIPGIVGHRCRQHAGVELVGFANPGVERGGRDVVAWRRRRFPHVREPQPDFIPVSPGAADQQLAAVRGERYGFCANVNPAVDHPRWSQTTERRIGEFFRRKTLMLNGYADDVQSLYAAMDLRRNY